MVVFLLHHRKQLYLWAWGDVERSREMAKYQQTKLDKEEKLDKMDKLDQDDTLKLSKIRAGLDTIMLETKEPIPELDVSLSVCLCLSGHCNQLHYGVTAKNGCHMP